MCSFLISSLAPWSTPTLHTPWPSARSHGPMMDRSVPSACSFRYGLRYLEVTPHSVGRQAAHFARRPYDRFRKARLWCRCDTHRTHIVGPERSHLSRGPPCRLWVRTPPSAMRRRLYVFAVLQTKASRCGISLHGHACLPSKSRAKCGASRGVRSPRRPVRQARS